MLVEDKHSISVLAEQILFARLRAFDEDDNLSLQDKAEGKKKAIEVFVKEYAQRSTLLSEEEVRKLVNDVIARTYRNINGEDR